MRYICTKCGSDNLEYDLWMDVRTGIPVEHGTPVYYCNKCEALVDVNRLEDEETTIDPEPTADKLSIPFFDDPWYDVDGFNSLISPAH